jgi:hypothetical protein
MMKPLKFAFFTLLISMVTLAACKKERQSNKAPIANAGPDQSVSSLTDSVILDGSSSHDPDGKIINYSWRKIAGPPPSNIVNGSIAKTYVKNLVAGVYLFELKVTDNGGLSSKDELIVIVTNIIKARIVEWNTDRPVEGVNVSICTSPLLFSSTNQNPCAGTYLSIVTDGNGECVFEADKFRFNGASKDDYWGYQCEIFNTFFGDDSNLQSNGIHTADSFVVKIIPKAYISIHIKNNINSGIKLLYRLGLPSGYNGCGWFPGDVISLRANIDTTFQYLVFGNSYNIINVADYMDDGFNPVNPVYSEYKYIPKINNIIVNILY